MNQGGAKWTMVKAIGTLWAMGAAVAAAAGDASLREETAPHNSNRLRCNFRTQHVCVRCAYDDNGFPAPEPHCVDDSIECPEPVCCDLATEEACHDPITGEATHCAKLEEGGCPCPEGEEKCGVNNYSSGYCTTLCCEASEETCYDENHVPILCRREGDKPCPKRKPEVRCDPETEETCHDGHGKPIFCRREGDHPCPKPFLPPPAVVIYDLLVLDVENITTNLIEGGMLADENLPRLFLGFLLIFVGQLLNYTTFTALGAKGVYYSYEFGYPAERATCFPYNIGISDPQYWGVVLCIFGIYTAVGATSMKVLENERGRRWALAIYGPGVR